MANGMTLKGDKQLERMFRTLGERVQRKVLRSAVSASATPVLRSARAKAPRRSGLLRKSLGKKVVTNKKAQSASAVIGARKSVRGPDGQRPARYLHLVEKPHIGPGGEYVPGQPFLNPSLDESKGQAEDVMAAKLREGVEREAMKGGRS